MFNMKTCTRCSRSLPETEFSRRKNGSLVSTCKECKTEIAVEWQRKNKDRYRENQSRWRKNNREKMRAYDRKWRELNPEKAKETYDKYNSSEKGKQTKLIHVHKRLSMLRKVEFSLTQDEWSLIKRDHSNRCAGRGIEFDETNPVQIDHKIPLSKGGATTKENIQPLCSFCNNSKGNKTNWTYPLVAEWT